MDRPNAIIYSRIKDNIELKTRLLNDNKFILSVDKLAKEIISCIKRGNKIILCGNGGSASDALHFAGEIIGRFQKEREAWPALVLNADVATMTAIANDYGYDQIYSRQIYGQVDRDDIFIGISTSGNSKNIINANEAARKKGAKTAALLGKDGGELLNMVDLSVLIPCDITARVQECHILTIHIICEIVENTLSYTR